MTLQIGWALQETASLNGSPRYFSIYAEHDWPDCHYPRWTNILDWALMFAREEDAERFRAVLDRPEDSKAVQINLASADNV